MTALAAATWTDVAVERAQLLVIPIGATEQHGPHLPLSTDTDIAVALAVRLGERLAGVLVAPALPYGASGEHAGFPGTLSLGARATELVLLELCRSADLLATRVLLLNAHGGNAEPVAAAVALLRREGRDVRAWSPAAAWRGGDAHAGRTETSVQLALDAPVRAGAAAPGATAPLVGLLPALRAHGVRAVSPNGVLGDPTGASAAEGRALLDAASDELLASVTGWLAEASFLPRRPAGSTDLLPRTPAGSTDLAATGR